MVMHSSLIEACKSVPFLPSNLDYISAVTGQHRGRVGTVGAERSQQGGLRSLHRLVVAWTQPWQMSGVFTFHVLLESCREISSNSSQRARTLTRYQKLLHPLMLRGAAVSICASFAGFTQDVHTSLERKALLLRAQAALRHVSPFNYIPEFTDAVGLQPSGLIWPLVQDQSIFRPPASQPGHKQVTIKGASQRRKGKSKLSPSKQLPDPTPGDEPRQQPVAAPVAAARRAMFAERLHDAQRIEDLFEVNLTGIFCACTAQRIRHT